MKQECNIFDKEQVYRVNLNIVQASNDLDCNYNNYVISYEHIYN